jgi:hypothetical protein
MNKRNHFHPDTFICSRCDDTVHRRCGCGGNVMRKRIFLAPTKIQTQVVKYIPCHFTDRNFAAHIFFSLPVTSPTRARAASFLRVQDHTQRHTTVERTSLDEWSAHCRDLYLTPHSNKRQKCTPSAEFEPAIPASYRPQNLTLDRSASRIGWGLLMRIDY